MLTCRKGTERRGQGGFVGRAALRVFGYVQGMNPQGAICKSPLPQNLDLATDMPDKDFNKSQVIYSGWHHSLLGNFVGQPSAMFAAGAVQALSG